MSDLIAIPFSLGATFSSEDWKVLTLSVIQPGCIVVLLITFKAGFWVISNSSSIGLGISFESISSFSEVYIVTTS